MIDATIFRVLARIIVTRTFFHLSSSSSSLTCSTCGDAISGRAITHANAIARLTTWRVIGQARQDDNARASFNRVSGSWVPWMEPLTINCVIIVNARVISSPGILPFEREHYPNFSYGVKSFLQFGIAAKIIDEPIPIIIRAKNKMFRRCCLL